MDSQIIDLAILSASGAALAQMLVYIKKREIHLRYDILNGIASVLVSCAISTAYFAFFDKNHGPLVPVQHGLFVALLIEFIGNGSFLSKNASASYASQPASAHGGPSMMTGAMAASVSGKDATIQASALVISGFLPVFLVGAFGALVAELAIHLKENGSNSIEKNKVIWIAIISVISGVITAFHGVDNINAMTAMQLGAAGPCVGLVLRKNPSPRPPPAAI